MKENYKLAKLTPGVISFIKLAKFNKLKLYVVSGSDQNELIKLFKKKKLEFYFDLILGSPFDKYNNIYKFILPNQKDYARGLFFGDSKYDFECSQHFNFDFVYVSKYSEWFNVKKKDIEKFKTSISTFNSKKLSNYE